MSLTLTREQGDLREAVAELMGKRSAEAEVRRLMAWFNEKFFEEASGPLVTSFGRLFSPTRTSLPRSNCTASVSPVSNSIIIGLSTSISRLTGVSPGMRSSTGGNAFSGSVSCMDAASAKFSIHSREKL